MFDFLLGKKCGGHGYGCGERIPKDREAIYFQYHWYCSQLCKEYADKGYEAWLNFDTASHESMNEDIIRNKLRIMTKLDDDYQQALEKRRSQREMNFR